MSARFSTPPFGAPPWGAYKPHTAKTWSLWKRLRTHVLRALTSEELAVLAEHSRARGHLEGLQDAARLANVARHRRHQQLGYLLVDEVLDVRASQPRLDLEPLLQRVGHSHVLEQLGALLREAYPLEASPEDDTSTQH